jgi:hypothetical protein
LPGNDEKRGFLKKRRLVRYQSGEVYRILDDEPEEGDVSTTGNAAGGILGGTKQLFATAEKEVSILVYFLSLSE